MATRASGNKKKSKARNRKGNSGGVGSRGTVAKVEVKGNKHNGPPGMSDAEKRAAIDKLDRLYQSYLKINDEAKSAKTTYTNELKSWAKKGLDKEAYVEARDLNKEDHGSVRIRYANIGDQLRIRKSNLATEMGLFQDIGMPQQDEDEAPAVKGLRAGREGFARSSNPYTPGSDDYQAYDMNWKQGESETKEALRTGEPAGSA